MSPLLAAGARGPSAGKEGRPYQTVRPLMCTYDAIYFHGDWIGSKLIMAVEEFIGGKGAGAYSHIGLVIRGDAFPCDTPLHTPRGPSNAAYIFEAQNCHADGVANVNGTTAAGVQLRDLDRVVEAYDRSSATKLAWCSMRRDRRPSSTAGWPALYARYEGRPFDWPNFAPSAFSCLRPLRQLFRCCCSCLGGGHCGCQDDAASRLLCSELVATIFKDLGVIPGTVNAENVIPSDFLVRPRRGSRSPPATFDADGEIPAVFEAPVPFTFYPSRA